MTFQQIASQNLPEDEELDNTELAAALSTPTPKFGELLFPGFNLIVPQFVEYVIPNIAGLSAKEAAVMIDTFH